MTEELTDALDTIQANIESAVTAAQKTGSTVYVATYFFMREEWGTCDPLPLNLLLPGQAANGNVYIARLNDRIRDAVDNRSDAVAGAPVVLVDIEMLNDTLRADADNYENCNHLSEQGNEIVAQLFHDVMTSEGG